MVERTPELRRLLATLGALVGLTVLLVAFFALVLGFAARHSSGVALLAAAVALAVAGLAVFGWSMHALARNWRNGPPGTNEV